LNFAIFWRKLKWPGCWYRYGQDADETRYLDLQHSNAIRILFQPFNNYLIAAKVLKRHLSIFFHGQGRDQILTFQLWNHKPLTVEGKLNPFPISAVLSLNLHMYLLTQMFHGSDDYIYFDCSHLEVS